MNDKERSAAFDKIEKSKLKALEDIKKDTTSEAITLLKKALKDIKLKLASSPTEWQSWYLPQLKAQVLQSLKELELGLVQKAGVAADAAKLNGIGRIDAGLIAAGRAGVVSTLPSIDTQRLLSMRAFMLDRLTNIPQSIVTKINAQLGLVSIGSTSRFDAIQAISKMLTKGGVSRARTILGTELGRISEVALHQRREQIATSIPGAKKQWRRSGKIHSRAAHDRVDGQKRDIDKSFDINGEKLMHPRDPKAPASETINCGCFSKTIFDDWEVKTPNKKKFGELETKQHPTKKILNEEIQ